MLTLRELKTYINSIPSEMDEFAVVNGEFGLDKDGNTFIMKSHGVHTAYVDVKNKEVQFLHQTDKDIKDMIIGLDGDS